MCMYKNIPIHYSRTSLTWSAFVANKIGEHLLNKLLKYPFKHDLMADRVSTEVGNHRMTNILPFPERKHMNKMNWITYDTVRAVIKIYILLL